MVAGQLIVAQDVAPALAAKPGAAASVESHTWEGDLHLRLRTMDGLNIPGILSQGAEAPVFTPFIPAVILAASVFPAVFAMAVTHLAGEIARSGRR